MALSEDQKTAYARDGFLAGIDVFDAAEVAAYRTEIEALERDHAAGAGGHGLNQFFRVNGQLVIPLLGRIARTSAILDAVSDVLGPDLLVWSVELFIKEPGTKSVVSWHQDLTYWGMGETDEELTAWVALSDVSVQAGCMRFMPGSHKGAIVPHGDTFDPDNLLSRGQQIAGVDEAQAVHGPLAPGQMSFHHGRCFHASGPNQSDDRRIGCAIRYVTPGVRQSDMGRDYAMLVRGRDSEKGWINVAGATRLFDPVDLALYDEVLAHQSTALSAGAMQDVGLYAAKGGTA
jgi:chlorinating enzyme